MRFATIFVALTAVLLATACQQKSQESDEQTPPGPLETSEAEAMLLRSLQAEASGDFEAEKADLFPRQHTVLATCAKLRIDNGKMASMAMRDENGKVPEITGVTVSNLHPQGERGFAGQYSAQGNSAYSGSEMFVWANGRWWIKCNI